MKKDITGQKAHMLTAVEYIGKNDKNRSLWKCVCDCGNETVIEIQKFGTTKSCGCAKKENGGFRDLSGKKFGRWLVLCRAQNKLTAGGYTCTMWTCRCECGEIRDVSANNLISGASKSCGCVYTTQLDDPSRYSQDLSGKKISHLIVVEKLDNHPYIDRDTLWKCICDCGEAVTRRSEILLRDGEHTCGHCLRNRGYRIEKGYIYIYKPEHPGNKDGWIREHIYNYEVATGLTFPRGYNLHHIDMNKQNNDISNLYLCTKKQHTEAHKSFNRIVKELMDNGIIQFSNGEYHRVK